MPMKYAVIGTSWITKVFIEGARLSGNMRLMAVYSRSIEHARQFGASYGCDVAFDSLDALAAYDGVEAVYVASPNSLHYAQCKLLLKNGKHVLCEKPVTVTLEQYDELTELADRNGLVYMEAIMFMHHPQLDKVKRAMGKLGKITTARLDFSQLSSKYDALARGENPNVFSPGLAGGSLMDMSAYCLYPAMEWFGDPDAVFARAGMVRTGADGYVNGLLAYKGRQVNVTISKIGQSRIGSEVMGDKGTLVVEYLVLMSGVWLIDREGNRQRVIEDVPREALMGAEADDFARYVRERNQYELEYRYMQKRARQVVKVMDAMRKMIMDAPG
jgi:predicted dehydrogenase